MEITLLLSVSFLIIIIFLVYRPRKKEILKNKLYIAALSGGRLYPREPEKRLDLFREMMNGLDHSQINKFLSIQKNNKIDKIILELVDQGRISPQKIEIRKQPVRRVVTFNEEEYQLVEKQDWYIFNFVGIHHEVYKGLHSDKTE